MKEDKMRDLPPTNRAMTVTIVDICITCYVD